MARHFVLYHTASSETGRNLTTALKEAGLDIDGGTEVARRHDVLIRWGSQRQVAYRPRKTLNSLLAIRRTSNKLDALRALEGGRVKVPTIYEIDDANIEFPVLGRKVSHVGGRDVILCLQRSDIQRARNEGCEYFVKYIPKAHEYRVHVFNGEVIKVSEKLLTEPEKVQNTWVWNFDNGYTFREPQTRPRYQALGMAVDAVDLMSLNFGAVDLIVSDDGYPFVLETNTAPGLIDASIEIYVENFKRVIEQFERQNGAAIAA